METRTTKQTMSRTHTVVPSPIGPLTVVAEGGALVRLAMSPPGRFVDAEIGERSEEGFGDVVAQLGEYFAGSRRAFDLPVDLRLAHGFRREVLDLIEDGGPVRKQAHAIHGGGSEGHRPCDRPRPGELYSPSVYTEPSRAASTGPPKARAA